MHRLIASFGCLVALVQSAQADPDALTLAAPSPSETEQAEPDWYQQFTFSNANSSALIDGAPAWQTQPSKTLNLGWIEGDRWSLSVDLTSRDEDSPLPREEMMAEAEFRITPRISIGGELTIGADELDDTTKWEDQQIKAGVRLRSAFKF